MRPGFRLRGRVLAIALATTIAGGATAGLTWWTLTSLSVSSGAAADDLASSGGPDARAMPVGWTKLPPPPEVRDGAAQAWDGRELLLWGGCSPNVHDHCVETRGGYAFDPETRTWAEIPDAPAAASGAEAVWTGTEVVFLGIHDRAHVDGLAYEPVARTWRWIAEAPIAPRSLGVRVWTGSRILVWGGGRPRDIAARDGAAYDPSTDRWEKIASAPEALNLASGVWTGREVIVFGSLLDDRNRAATPTSVGEAYDPSTDSWQALPPSALSPQATSAAWIGGRVVAWDYDVHSQAYDPVAGRWNAPREMPLRFSECYPQSTLVAGYLFAFFCGQAALYDPSAEAWTQIHGGPLDTSVDTGAYETQLWRFASVTSSGDAAFFLMEGITSSGGEACYGCEGSPHSFWAYRPPASLRHAAGSPPKLTRWNARSVAEDFMVARILHSQGQIEWLVTPEGAALFGHSGIGAPEPLLFRGNFRLGPAHHVPGRPGVYAVEITLWWKHVPGTETLLVGPGRSIGGERAPLVVIGIA